MRKCRTRSQRETSFFTPVAFCAFPDNKTSSKKRLQRQFVVAVVDGVFWRRCSLLRKLTLSRDFDWQFAALAKITSEDGGRGNQKAVFQDKSLICFAHAKKSTSIKQDHLYYRRVSLPLIICK